MSEQIPLTPNLLYKLVWDQMKTHESECHFFDKATQSKRLDEGYRNILRRNLCLWDKYKFDNSATNACNSRMKASIYSLINVQYIPIWWWNVEREKWRQVADAVMNILEEKNYELY